MLSKTDQVLCAATLWREVCMNFPYWSIRSLDDWNVAFRDLVERCLNDSWGLADLYDEMAIFCAKLEDPHTTVIPPAEVMAARGTVADVFVEIEGRILVGESDVLHRGAEVLAIDGVPIETFLENASKRIAGSSRAYRRAIALDRLGWGIRGTEMLVETRTDVIILRRTVDIGVPVQSCVVHPYTDNTFIIKVCHWDRTVLLQIHDCIKDWRSARGIVLDLRECRGGDLVSALSLLRMFLRQPHRLVGWRSPQYVPYWRGLGWPGTFVSQEGPLLEPNKDTVYHGPLAVLIGAKTVSAGENFAWEIKRAGRATLFGEPTSGAMGAPFSFPLIGGGVGLVSTRAPDLPEMWLGRGCQPDVFVQPTLESFFAQRDCVLDGALAWIDEG